MKVKKICGLCGEAKEITRFSRNRSSKDGLQCYCKECSKQYREDNIRAYRERWEKEDPYQVSE
jgi:superfamily II helicase